MSRAGPEVKLHRNRRRKLFCSRNIGIGRSNSAAIALSEAVTIGASTVPNRGQTAGARAVAVRRRISPKRCFLFAAIPGRGGNSSVAV
jgi:hypothetical protein